MNLQLFQNCCQNFPDSYTGSPGTLLFPLARRFRLAAQVQILNGARKWQRRDRQLITQT